MQRLKKMGFTLVELIVVITVLAILGTIGFMSFQGYSKDARDSKRISDINNIKTGLEMFFVKNGEYPMPDSFSTISYSGTDVWYQGSIGDGVIINLANLNNKPIDPLLNTEYTYSITESYEEYEVLALYEGSLVVYNSILPQTNAVLTGLTPKIEGSYNKVFVETPSYIIPTPSIITSEPLTGGILKLNSLTIKSQVITDGINVPNTTLMKTITGSLNIKLSVYTGSIKRTSTDTQKINAIKQIQSAYTGSSISNKGNIAYILNKSSTGDLLVLSNTVILKTQTSLATNTSSPPPPPPASISSTDCTNLGQVLYSTADGTDVGLTCSNDIIICSGSGTGYTISACNAGASIVYTGGINQAFNSSTEIRSTTLNAWAGGMYQWGNNADLSLTGSTTSIIPASSVSTVSTYNNPNSFIETGSKNSGDWVSPKVDDLWGTITNTLISKIGPCNTGYHVPSTSEFNSITSGYGSNGSLMLNELKLPLGGNRHASSSSFYKEGSNGYYWTVSLNASDTTKSDYLKFTTSSINISSAPYYSHANAMSVRCFKN